jgi:YD repeat-containing protein
VDEDDNLTAIADPDGSTVQYGYSTPANHRLTTDVNPDGHMATATYDAFGQLTGEVLFNGTSNTTMTAELSQDVVAAGGTATLTLANETSVTDPNGDATTIEFNRMGHPVGETDDAGDMTTMTYDRHGFLATETDALGMTSYKLRPAGERQPDHPGRQRRRRRHDLRDRDDHLRREQHAHLDHGLQRADDDLHARRERQHPERDRPRL